MDSFENQSWVFSETIKFEYSLDTILRYFYPSNQIWYYLSHKWAKYSEGVFNDTFLEKDYFSSKAVDLINRINPSYRGRKLDRLLLADIGSDFHGKYLEELYELTEANRADLPRSTRNLLFTQIILLGFGVLTPLVASMIKINPELQLFLLKFCTSVVVSGLLLYLFQIFDFTKREIGI